MRVLVTGGAGYIGSHTCVELLNAGFNVTIFDNFMNSSPAVAERIKLLTSQNVEVVNADVRDRKALIKTMRENSIDAVIHFAGLKAVGESVSNPLAYYDNNVVGLLTLLDAMKECGLNTFVFSSSATVYGAPNYLPLNEVHPLSATNPYGRSKLMIEDILRDLFVSDGTWRIALLRYFNPVGAHFSGAIGENPQGTPNNLMPFLMQVAANKREYLNVWGDDYDTLDGTGVRDYIHVVDLALGHIKALQRLSKNRECLAVNLGTGKGYSVLEVIKTFERVTNQSVPYRICDRRPGDVAACYADSTRAYELLGWKAELGLDAMCADAWRWQQLNPNGYE
ncbi:MAG: UDP-glucose 4-epimerase GalE [Burkholderiaceae bacterium]|nr:UDP-glucose 4-epimerase GalE [Burkholderiaceae bacterium]